MTKKDYIKIADALKPVLHDCGPHSDAWIVLDVLCDTFQKDNPNFKIWVFKGYIAGECGPTGGKIK